MPDTFSIDYACLQISPFKNSVVNSYIALRSFVVLFNSLIFFTSFDIYRYYHSCLASEFLPDLIGEYKEFFTELFHSVFSYFVVPFFNTLGGTIM